MIRDREQAPERPALELTPREWVLAALLVAAALAAAVQLPLRKGAPAVDQNYRIPYALSTRYDLYRRFTTLAVGQYPTLIVGDSVVWGQCARRNETLAYHLNLLAREPRFVNAGLDGMHPVALAELLYYYTPAVVNTRVIVQFDPIWLMLHDASERKQALLANRSDLIPRLATHFTGLLPEAATRSWSRLLRSGPVKTWSDGLADARLDFLAWSLDHPYESPLRAISSALPPSEDSHPQKLTPWIGGPEGQVSSRWAELANDEQWKAFIRLLTQLRSRGNDVLVLLGPMNEHMMTPETLASYLPLKARIAEEFRAMGFPCFVPSVLPSDQYSDICHPLGPGYAGLAREMLEKESGWLLGRSQGR
jgi:hypothetical protein